MKAETYQVILDTNVLVAALRSQLGASFRLLSLIGDPRFQISLSVALVLEYEDVLKRPEIGIGLTHREIDDVIDFLCQNANLCEIFYLWRPTLRDAKDDFLLEPAVESETDYIITFNTRDFAGSNQFGVEAIQPRDFLKVIGEVE